MTGTGSRSAGVCQGRMLEASATLRRLGGRIEVDVILFAAVFGIGCSAVVVIGRWFGGEFVRLWLLAGVATVPENNTPANSY